MVGRWVAKESLDAPNSIIPASLTILWFKEVKIVLDQENSSDDEEKIRYRVMRLCLPYRHQSYAAYQKNERCR